MLKVQILPSVTDEVISKWEKLWKNSSYAHIANSPGWFLAAQKAFAYKEALLITIYEDATNELVAIAPFVKTKIYGISLYTAPAIEFADRPQLLVDYKNKKLLKLFYSEIAKLGNVYIACFTKEMLTDGELPKSSRVFPGDVEPYIDFSEGPYGSLSSRKRNVVLNRLKKSNQKYKIITVAQNPSEALEKAFKIDMISTKHSKGKGVFFREEVREFYRQLAYHNPSNIIVTLALFDDKPVSYLIGFICNNVHSGSQKAYLSGLEYFSLGRLLLIALLDYFRENTSVEFNFGKGHDQFKKGFTSHYNQLYNVVISKNKLVLFSIEHAFSLQKKGYEYLSRFSKLYALYSHLKGN